MNLPTITTKQQEIIKLLYKHRFLERKHIQQYLGHIDKRRSSRWLKDLKEKKFVDWIYDTDNPSERSTPAIYFMDINGLRLLGSLGVYPESELRKRYKDGERQKSFINKCLLLAECTLHLDARNRQSDCNLRYEYALEPDYIDPDSDFHFLEESEYIHPDLAFTKSMEADDEDIYQTYIVELFDITTPRYMVKKKIKGYVECLASNEW